MADQETAQLAKVRVGAQDYCVSPPLSYVLRPDGEHITAEAEEFHLFVIGDDKRSAQAELRKHFAALVEGYALEDDSQLAPSGKRLKERLLGRIRLV